MGDAKQSFYLTDFFFSNKILFIYYLKKTTKKKEENNHRKTYSSEMLWKLYVCSCVEVWFIGEIFLTKNSSRKHFFNFEMLRNWMVYSFDRTSISDYYNFPSIVVYMLRNIRVYIFNLRKKSVPIKEVGIKEEKKKNYYKFQAK